MKLEAKGVINAIFTTIDIPVDGVIWQMQGDIITKPDKYSIQIDFDKHLGSASKEENTGLDDDICHACEANTKIDFSDLTIRARRNIKAGEEITLNYCASEEVLANPFHCTCSSVKCYGYVRGFQYLTTEQQQCLKEDLSQYLKNKYGLV